MTTTMMISIPMLICFFALMIGVGFYCRKHSTNVDEKFSCYDVEVVTNKKDSLG